MTGQHSDVTTRAQLGGLRRRPTQRRSKERVKQILEATAELLDEGGYNVLSTTMIAERAQVSVGSIYQFFSNVDGIITELARGWMAEFDRILGMFAEMGDLPLQESINVVVDAYVKFLRHTPGFGAVYFNGRLRGNVRSLDRQSTNDLARMLAYIWGQRYQTVPSDRLEVIARVSVHMGDSLLAVAFHTDRAGDEAIIEETKRALGAYVTRALCDAGLPAEATESRNAPSQRS